MPEIHSILSASSAHRWLNCTPSARLEMLENAEECSVYAEEGTAAHALAEIKLNGIFGKTTKEETERRLTEYHSKEVFEKYFNKEFEEYVDDYVNFVVSKTKDLENFHIFFEFKVDFSHIVPQGFGTADTIIVTNDTIRIIDLKFGQGVPVSAINNPQLRLYAVGASNLFPLANKITTSICQPRLLNSDTEELTKEELISWAVDYVKPRAELAIKGEGVFCSDESTCKWCKLRGKCKVRADRQLEIAKREFSVAPDNGVPELETMTGEQIAEILDAAPKFVDWFKDVNAYALGQLMQGKKIPGYKLVEGRSVRIITNPERIEKELLDIGFSEDEIMKPRELLGISALEKLIGKKNFALLFEECIVKPQGKLTLAPNTDRRPEVTPVLSAKRDFALPVKEEN